MLLLLGAMALSNADFMRLGNEAMSSIERRFRGEGGHYVEFVDGAGKPSKEPAFLWGLGVQLSALAAAARVDKRTYQPRLEELRRDLQRYAAPGKPDAFSVWPGLQEPDRYYDDNVWVALALTEAYGWLRDKQYLLQAQRVFDFVMSGEDDKLGGGIYWREREKNGKNTCINAPATLVAYKLYRATKERRYREVGDRLWAWTKQLQDTDGLFFDNMSLSGHIERTKWSYNSALPIRVQIERFRITKAKKELEEAVRIARASEAHWVDEQTGAIHDDASFAHHLCDAFVELSEVSKDESWRHVAERALARLAELGKNADGLYAKRWDGTPAKDEARYLLLWQASAARAYFRVSIHEIRP